MKIAVHGAAGRMGKRVTALAAENPRYTLVAALESADHPALGQDAGLLAGVGPLGVLLGVVGESDADVVIDFSVPDAAIAVTKHCLEFKKPLESINLDTKQKQEASYERSDVCAVSAASVIVENVVAFEVACALTDKFGGDVAAILEDIRQREQESGRVFVTFAPPTDFIAPLVTMPPDSNPSSTAR